MTRRRRTAGVLSVIALGSGLVVSSVVGGTTAAQASPFPSWADVQAAKAKQSSTEAESSAIDAQLRTLQQNADSTTKSALGAGERYQVAVLAQQSQQVRLASLTAQQKAASTRAEQSRDEVGQLVAQLSRTGGGQLSVSMLADSGHASDLLYKLGAMSHLTARTTDLFEQARRDQGVYSSLSTQARAAEGALSRDTAAASAALAKANALAATAASAAATQQQNESQLIAQIAFLKGTTADLEAQYYASVANGVPAKAPAAVPTAATGSAAPAPAGSSPAPRSGSSTSSVTAPASPSAAPTPVTPSTPPAAPPVTPPAAPPATAPTPPPPAPPAGTPAAVSTAIAYARAQVGKPYAFGGAGPNVFDCSGLMMAAYGAAGVGIGGHSVHWQWDYLGGEGRLVSRSAWRPGDILFYHDGPDGYYHDAMYLGGGLMVEAPNPSAPVRIVGVRYTDLEPVVGRPVG